MVALLDSSVVAAFLDRDDPHHAGADQRIRELAGREQLITSAITYAELLTGAVLGHHDRGVVRGFFRDLIDAVYPVDERVAEFAAEIRGERRSLRLPDALILATAGVHGIDIVITADQRWRGLRGTPGVEVLAARPG